MGENQKGIEIHDEKTGEVFTLNPVSLVSDVRDRLLSARRLQTEATVWGKLPEAKQRDEIAAMQQLASDLVEKVVEAVAERGLVCAHVAVNKFAVDVDKGTIQITASGRADDEMLSDLNHAKGKVGKLTIVDTAQFNAKSKKPSAEVTPDEPKLPLDDGSESEPEGGDGGIADMHQNMADADDQLDDSGDDLQIDGDGEDENLPSDQWRGGHQSRMAGHKLDENPFDDDTSEFDDWAEGWGVADQNDDAPDLETGEVSDVEADGGVKIDGAETASETSIDDMTSEEVEATTSEPDAPEGNPKQEGQDARMAELGPDSNPYDGGTVDHLAWADSWTAADGQIKALEAEGEKDFAEGSKGSWKEGTDGHKVWLRGWERAAAAAKEKLADVAPEDQAAADAETDAAAADANLTNDSHGQGYRAAERGEDKSSNPYGEGTTKGGFWDEGFDSFQQPVDGGS